MGGTFDPIHYGHLAAASQVHYELGLDRVVFVPTGRPWQKRESDVSDGEHRFLMTVLATTADPRFRVSRVDLDRPGPTYTVDTLADLQVEFGPRARLYLIVGADALTGLATWRDHDKVLAAARLVAVPRPGFPRAQLKLEGVDLDVIEVPGLAVSSSCCRERVATGEPITYLVPPLVQGYIANNGLYGTTT